MTLAAAAAILPATADTATVVGRAKIVDGDTLDVGSVRVRLYGVDTPEPGQECERANGSAWSCGTQATNRLAELAEDMAVRCEPVKNDDYGRVVAYCWRGDTSLNETLIDEGLAWAFVKYTDVYVDREGAAKAARVGIWDGAAQPAWEYRARRWEVEAQTSPRPGCPIKGNISQQGERIYHTPWSRDYHKTRVTEDAGERWFCDEAEAIEAGWRAPYWR